MPVCANCGQENLEVARFCLACGAPLVDHEVDPKLELEVRIAVNTGEALLARTA